MVNDKSKEHAGVILSLIEEFEKHRLPRLFRLKEKVDNGEVINDVDIDFLCKVIEDANRTMPMTVTNPELHEFCLTVTHLYREICDKAMENEKKK